MEKYTGTDNLEVMALAVNYNAFLTELVLRYAGDAAALLDFGAGIGTFAATLVERGRAVSCIETDTDQAGMIAAKGIPVQQRVSDYPDNSFDFIYSLNVLEHIEDDVQALTELRRVLKPQGKIFIYVPALNVLYSSMDRKVGHHRRYSRRSLQHLGRSAGYRVSHCRYADSLGFPATLLFKLTNNTSGDLNPGPLTLYDKWIFPLSRLGDYLTSRLFGKNVYCVLEKA
jgi:SAM-dependent methyltransferase